MEKINIAEILKDCPKGMELDCVMYKDVYFDYVDELNIIHCYIQHEIHKTSVTFNQYGAYNSVIKSKCVIYPKGKTTWEGFQIPFKDGDIVIQRSGAICIYKSIHKTYKSKNFIDFYCGYRSSDNQLVIKDSNDSHFGPVSEAKLAIEEEKQKLFEAIKANGYKWKPETKTLEKLIEPKFKVGGVVMKLWIARDKIGSLCMFCEKPILKDGTIWYHPYVGVMLLKRNLFPELTFENSPQQVEIKLIENEKDI
jgi:hypothetical protein